MAIIGEAAGRHEAKDSLPFRPHAAAGGLLQRLFRLSGLKREDFVIYNAIACQPQNNELVGMPYEAAALAHCRPNLDAVITEYRPRIILALGDVPLRELSTVSGSISELRGFVLPSIYGCPLISTWHPSYLARGEKQGMMRLFGAFMHDIRRAVSYATYGIPNPLPTNYQLTPKLADVALFLGRLRNDPSLLVSVDVETGAILGWDESENWKEKRIVQIQFSCGEGEAIVIPFDDTFRELIQQILLTDNPKIGWYSRNSDEIVLRARGFSVKGDFFDGSAMFSHLQPGFSSGKDASDDEDKGVPARLLNLQSAISFYFPYEPLWKSQMRRALGTQVDVTDELWQDVRYGGARDADLTLRVGLKLIAALRAQNLWHGYYRYKHQLGIVLSKMSDRGLPIDRDEQLELAATIAETETALDAELQSMIPDQLKPLHPPDGYKGFPKDLREAVKAAGLWVKKCKATEFPDHAAALGYRLQPFDADGDIEYRLCKPLPFNSGSNKQILSYIQHRVDTVGRPWFIPLHIDTKKPSTNKASIESLIALTDDPALKQIEKCKKMTKLKDYTHGKWEPEADGRVHAEFRVGATATGQTTATNPPIQTYPKHVNPDDLWLVPIIKRIKTTIKAEAGHTMVEVDARGFHARVQGFLAGDADYYRLADSDLHSFNTAHYLKLPDAHQLRYLDDDALRQRLKEIKSQHSYERNFILKRIAFLRQFSGGAEKAATIMKIPVVEVMAIFNMMDELFKPTFKGFPASIEKQLRTNPRLTSQFGCIRYFWDQDLQQAVAFLPANSAHCHIQDALIRLDERGALDRYQAVNFVHDSVWYMCPTELVDECIAMTKEEFERPSDVLVSEKLGRFFVHADASVGPSMGELRDA